MLHVKPHFWGTAALVARLAVGPLPQDPAERRFSFEPSDDPAAVSLGDQEMENILGGQSNIDLFCSAQSIANASLWYYLTGSFTGIMLRCAAALETDIIDMQVTQPLRDNVHSWLQTLQSDWVYSGFRWFENVWVYGQAENIELPAPWVTSLDFEGLLQADYCGYQGCACDSNLDCDDFYYCSGGYCHS